MDSKPLKEISCATHDRVFRLPGGIGYLALHRTGRGPCFGGIRIREYEEDSLALADVLRLSEAMTWKCAINDIPGGGGKSVLNLSRIRDREGALQVLAAAVEWLGGQYCTGPDLGFTSEDMRIVSAHTKYIATACLSEAAARGVLAAMRGALKAWKGSSDVGGIRTAIQGLGSVGWSLAQKLAESGALLSVSDIDSNRTEAACSQLQATILPPSEIVAADTDVLAPCALGGVVSRKSAAAIRCSIICGAANNILDADETAERLAARDIIYVPDFLSNSGATIQGAWTYLRGEGDYGHEVEALQDRTLDLLQRAQACSLSPLKAAYAWLREKEAL